MTHNSRYLNVYLFNLGETITSRQRDSIDQQTVWRSVWTNCGRQGKA